MHAGTLVQEEGIAGIHPELIANRPRAQVKYCLMNINDYKKVTLEEGSKMMMESSEVGPPRPGSFGKAPWMVHNPVDDNLGSRKKRSERSVTA